MAEVVVIETPTLGDRSYLVHDGTVGFVVDPQRDIDRVIERAGEDGVRIEAVFETHIHNDYVTGGYQLARLVGAGYHLNLADPVTFERYGVGDGDVLDVAPGLRVRVLATPGHTVNHLSYVLEEDGTPTAVFTGGSLLYSAVGRPDLLGPEHTGHLARSQYASARRLARVLPDDVAVYPTHGFGSFCAVGQNERTSSDIGAERRVNPALLRDERTFVEQLLAGLAEWPAYYARMAPLNLAGPRPVDLSPPESADPDELRQRIAAGEWAVDLRNRVSFAAGHLPGSVNFGLDGGLATYLGWLIPWGTPVILLADTAEEIGRAQRELVRIGIDRPAACATGGPQRWTTGQLGRFPRASFLDLEAARARDAVTVLDVRRGDEWAGGHLADARHIPLHELPGRIPELPPGEIWVYCAAGYRAAIAASLLAAAQRPVVAVDEEFGRVAETRLPLATG
ncbi:MAG: MBL fold metallo-hydrolase [Actinocatenispora sp.]